jgi:hypothetical protein
MGMSSWWKFALGAALAGFLVNALVRSREARDVPPAGGEEGRGRSSIDDVPELQPVRDAEPLAPEPLRDEDQRVAQNAPF